MDPWRIRLLSVLFGVLTIPVLYALGRVAIGRGGALFGCLFYALSPALVFHHQAIRPYALALFLAVIALYALVRAARGHHWSWWLLNAAAHTALAGTHPFFALVLLPEAVYAFLAVRRRALVLWLLAQAVLAAPWAWWLVRMPEMPFDAYLLYRPPGVADFFKVLLGGDIVRANVELRPGPGSWRFLNAQEDMFFGVQPLFNVLLWLAAGAGGAWGIATGVRNAKHQATARWRPVVLLSLTWLLPVLSLALLSHAWRPCMFPRYVLYILPVLHLLMGALLCRVPWRVVRGGFAVLVLLAYAYQVSLVAPVDARTSWRAVAKQIGECSSDEDIVLVCKTPGLAFPDKQILEWHLEAVHPPVYPAHTPLAVLEKAFCVLGQRPDARVWTVIQRSYQPLHMRELMEGFRTGGLACKRLAYPAGEGLLLYRLSRTDDFQPEPAFRMPTAAEVDYAVMFNRLGLAGSERAVRAEALRALPRLFDLQAPPPQTAQQRAEWALMAHEECAPRFARALAGSALAIDPHNQAALAALGFAALELGDFERTAEAFTTLERSRPVPGIALEPALGRLLQDRDPVALRPLVRQLLDAGMRIPHVTLVFLGLSDVDFCCATDERSP